MKKLISSIITIIFILIAGAVGKIIGKSASPILSKEPSKEQIADALINAAKKINAQTPIQVDEQTKMISAVATPSSLVYLYSVSFDFRDYDSNELFSYIRKNNLDGVCKNLSTFKFFVDNKLSLSYVYKDIYGNSLPQITINPKYDCVSSSYKY